MFFAESAFQAPFAVVDELDSEALGFQIFPYQAAELNVIVNH
jgi:hypothetical protein